MRERLREVAEHPARRRVVLLGDQPEVVAEAEQPLEERRRLLAAAHQRQVVDEPERAGEEHPLAARHPVEVVVGDIAAHQPVDAEPLLDRLDRAGDPRVLGRQEADQRQHQERAVERLAAVVLHEAVQPRVEPLAADLGVDPVGDRPPAVGRAGQPEAGHRLRRPVERHPGHHLGVGEVPPRPAHLPDAVVGLGPGLLHELDQLDLQPPGVVERVEVVLARDVERVHHLAEHVVLHLGPRQVADPDRPAVGIARGARAARARAAAARRRCRRAAASARASPPPPGAASAARPPPRRGSPTSAAHRA